MSDATAINESGAIAGYAQDGEDDHAAVWNLVPGPEVTSVSPSTGPTGGGTKVHIVGAHLATVTSVSFGPLAAPSFNVLSENEIEASTPPHTGTVDVIVRSPEGASELTPADRFSYVPPARRRPHLPQKRPSFGRTDDHYPWARFSPGQRVAFGTTAVPFTVVSPTVITARSPASAARTVDVTVTTPYGTSPATSKDHYRFGPPTITSITPNTGPRGGNVQVTVEGTGYGLGSEATTFKFGKSVATSVECKSTTTCLVTVPSHKPETVEVRAAVGGQHSPKSPPADEYLYE